MKQDELNQNLIQVIKEAQELNIPVPNNISEKVIINARPKKGMDVAGENGEFQIEISEFVLRCDPHKIRGVLAHEILHTCRDCYNHGAIWKKYASIMNAGYGYNIKRTSSYNEMGIGENCQGTDNNFGSNHQQSSVFNSKANSKISDLPKIRYIIKCQSCGREYPRQRLSRAIKNIDSYRCGCGGKLSVFKIR